MLQDPEGGETPRMEVKDEDAFNYTHIGLRIMQRV
jgi:hypothetical protein